MKRFFILRGAPGCGKSTWVVDNRAEHITISSDETRLRLVGTTINENGEEKISQANPEFVWNNIREQIYSAMKTGQDVILDSTALHKRDILAYDEYVNNFGYKPYIVDFTDIPQEICHIQNSSRESLRVVPEWVIDRYYDRLNDNSIPEGYEVITPLFASVLLIEE